MLINLTERAALVRCMVLSGATEHQAELCLDSMVPALRELVARHQRHAFERGSEDNRSRARNRPGDGDMGG